MGVEEVMGELPRVGGNQLVDGSTGFAGLVQIGLELNHESVPNLVIGASADPCVDHDG
jgi:hypothetical protein